MAKIFGRKPIHAALTEPPVLLQLEIPRTNDKKELAAEQMFASLHGILRPKAELFKEGIKQEHISFEIASIAQRIKFYVWCPKHLQTFVEGQIYAQYPEVQITTLTEDYAARDMPFPVVRSADITLIDNETIPIKTFPSFEVDPLAGITATLAELVRDKEEMWVQVLARPIPDNWHKLSSKHAARIKGGGNNILGQLATAFVKSPTDKPGDISERNKSRIAGIETKSTKLGYQVKIRVIYAGYDQTQARLRLQAMLGAFKQFNTTNLNGFKGTNPSSSKDRLVEYQLRHFVGRGFTLNIEELASVWHLPHTTVETPNIAWANSRTAEPPSNLPTPNNTPAEELSLFGATNFRGSNLPFGIRRGARGRHMYIIGQTGTGKSGLLELLTLSDVYYNQGFAVVDPHGDYALNILRFIPERRINDVVYFNPADREFPIGFNPLEVTDKTMKGHISSEIVGVLKRMFESWGPRLEYILRYTLLALLDYPRSTMLDITRMLTEKKFRDEVISYIDDPVVKNFWTLEFASWNEKYATEAVAPVLNKVGAFTANPMVRNIIGQPESTFNIRKIMDEGKILIVNLSRGLVGEDNAAILGALIVTKIQLAAMSRADTPQEERRPFYLYVDEFQNFATDSFAVILSEARKYALNLTVANQYIAQMNPVVKDAVFGNVGSIVCFRVGAEDGAAMAKYFAPQFEAPDLIGLNMRRFVSMMIVSGEKTAGFSGATLAIPSVRPELTEAIVAHSRSLYTKEKATVEQIILNNTFSNLQKAASQPPAPAKGSGVQKILHKLPGVAVAPTSPTNTPPAASATAAEPAKKRRRRRSKDKSNESSTKYEQKAAEPNVPESGHINQDFEIKLR